MSVGYQAILWNKQKKIYDSVLFAFIIIYLAGFFILNNLLFPTSTFETQLIRGFGSLAIILLHIILSIGPLARINRKFLVLLYNRRHLGVTMFIIASVHAIFSFYQFHMHGNLNPFLSLFLSNTHYESFIFFPFQTLGVIAYIILMLMAFTSHDFWLNTLSPKVWKLLHIMVYIAYGLLIAHVALGVIQLENAPIYFLMLLAGVIWLSIIHIIAGIKEWKFDNSKPLETDGWYRVCKVDEIEEDRAKMVIVAKERVAIFKYNNKLSAVHNVCKHQNGPLGEGKIVDGCITCPWHGYQYKPEDGCAPAPFTEKLATYALKLFGDVIYINPKANAEGTFVEPLLITTTNTSTQKTDDFYIGWQPKAAASFKKFVLKTIPVLFFIFLICLVCISFNQKHIAKSFFITDNQPKYEGTLIASPFPALRTMVGKDEYGNPIIKTYPLVNAWKFGADDAVASFLSKNNKDAIVQIQGTTLNRDDVTAIELSDEEASISLSSNKNIFPTLTIQSLGDTILEGQIIDPKCYLGAMNPGEGKPHRDCAIRCIEGGIMPMLTYQTKEGKIKYAVLLGSNGEKINQQISYAVAEPITIKGKMMQIDDWNFLLVDVKNGITRIK